MSVYFIAYGDERFSVSLGRIIRQARKTRRFDKIVKYTPRCLPDYVRSSPLFAETKGGGCWCWKPYIVSETLAHCNVGDVVYYVDAGCSLVSDSPEWDYYERLLQSHDAIYFQYRRDFSYPGWDKYCQDDVSDKTAVRHWIKPALAEYFLRSDDLNQFDFDSLWAGFFICKKTEKPALIIDQWLRITLMHPELVSQPFGVELSELPDYYYDHRCDQGLLTLLVRQYKKQDNAIVLPETSESLIGHPAVLATRWRQKDLPLIPYLKYRLFEFIHRK